MIELLAKLILMEAVVLIALSFKTFLRKPAKKAMDCVVKQGQAPIIVLTIGLTFLAHLISTLYIILQIHFRSIRAGSINPADQLLLPHKLLQASLTGFLLFLSVIIYKFHHLMRERGSLKKIIEAEEKQLEVRRHFVTVQVHELENEVARLRARIMKLESECQRKTYESNAKEAIVLALKKQSEGFNLEYDSLLEYNQILRNQLQSIDQILLTDEEETGWTGFKASIMPDGLNLIPWDTQEANKRSRAEVCSDNEVVTTNRCHKLLLSGSPAPSSPRHRRPIYQH